MQKRQFQRIVYSSQAIEAVVKQIGQVAPSEATVLLRGETGVGKGLIAQAIHALSRRKNRPFRTLNVATLPNELIERELFGHEQGAFTSAVKSMVGLLELTHGGTFLLDEIGRLATTAQAKLLRVIEDKVVRRLGATSEQAIDVRFIVATNQDLEQMIARQQFLVDLYYRINVLTIAIPPLRDRPEDIPVLLHHFLDLYNQKYSKRLHRVTADALRLLVTYPWPGNVRELQGVVERLVVHADPMQTELTPQGLPEPIQLGQSPIRDLFSHIGREKTLDEAIREIIHSRLVKYGWDVKRTAQSLDLHPRTLYYRMSQYGLQRPKSLFGDEQNLQEHDHVLTARSLR